MIYSELMIGDWVMPLRKSIGKPCMIVTIDGGTNACWIDNREYSGMVPCSELEPIPLTPEILEKNGFKNISDHTLKGCHTFRLDIEQRGYDYCVTIKLKDYFKLQSYDDRWYTLCEMEFGCRYVHKLQHAMRLCGIEKEIIV